MKPIPLVSMMLLVAALAACEKKAAETPAAPEPSAVDKVKQRTKETVNSTKEFVIQQKEQLQKSLSSKMTQFDKKLEELKGKAAVTSQKTRNQLSDTITQLQQKKEIAAKKLEQVRSSGAEAWQDIKLGAEKAFAEVEQAFNEASARFKNEDKSEQK